MHDGQFMDNFDGITILSALQWLIIIIIISLKAESDRAKEATAIAIDTSLDKNTSERKIENHIATKDYHSVSYSKYIDLLNANIIC